MTRDRVAGIALTGFLIVIASRVEKLKFLVDEMQLAFHLTMHLTDPFVARTLARHILIRAENFIEHARGPPQAA
jgi:hypothetical protein